MKLPLKKTKPKTTLPARITNDTVAEHREQILSGARRFKYPMQYARKKLVRNAIIIGSLVVLLMGGLLYANLYIWRASDDFIYRLTRVLPVPVAKADGETVRYSDYLLLYRSSISNLKAKYSKTTDAEGIKNMEDLQRRKNLRLMVEQAYASKIAREKNIVITDNQVQEFITQQRGSLSELDHYRAARKNFGWSPDEYRHITKMALLKQDVAFALDNEAQQTKHKVEEGIKAGKSLQSIASELGSAVEYGDRGFVDRNNQDGGLAKAALALEKGKTSKEVRTLTGDGYYFVTNQDSTEHRVHYDYIKIPLKQFQSDVNKLYDEHKVEYYIDDVNKKEVEQ